MGTRSQPEKDPLPDENRTEKQWLALSVEALRLKCQTYNIDTGTKKVMARKLKEKFTIPKTTDQPGTSGTETQQPDITTVLLELQLLRGEMNAMKNFSHRVVKTICYL